MKIIYLNTSRELELVPLNELHAFDLDHCVVAILDEQDKVLPLNEVSQLIQADFNATELMYLNDRAICIDPVFQRSGRVVFEKGYYDVVTPLRGLIFELRNQSGTTLLATPRMVAENSNGEILKFAPFETGRFRVNLVPDTYKISFLISDESRHVFIDSDRYGRNDYRLVEVNPELETPLVTHA